MKKYVFLYKIFPLWQKLLFWVQESPDILQLHS